MKLVRHKVGGSDGTLVVLAFRADRSVPDRQMFSPSGGLIDNEPILFTSYDDGHTWKGPQPIALPVGVVATPASTIAVTSGANSRIEASTKKPPRRSSAPKRTRKLAAWSPGAP